jgi:hypothetical protein
MLGHLSIQDKGSMGLRYSTIKLRKIYTISSRHGYFLLELENELADLK